MKTSHLKNKEIKKLSLEINELYGNELITNKDVIQIIEINHNVLLNVNGNINFFNYDEIWVPTLKLLHECPELLPSVTVDKGAIKFVSSGANIMRPGITKTDEFNKTQFVAIRECTHNKILAIGKSIYSSVELNQMKTGKVIINIHYVGDSIWNY